MDSEVVSIVHILKLILEVDDFFGFPKYDIPVCN